MTIGENKLPGRLSHCHVLAGNPHNSMYIPRYMYLHYVLWSMSIYINKRVNQC